MFSWSVEGLSVDASWLLWGSSARHSVTVFTISSDQYIDHHLFVGKPLIELRCPKEKMPKSADLPVNIKLSCLVTNIHLPDLPSLFLSLSSLPPPSLHSFLLSFLSSCYPSLLTWYCLWTKWIWFTRSGRMFVCVCASSWTHWTAPQCIACPQTAWWTRNVQLQSDIVCFLEDFPACIWVLFPSICRILTSKQMGNNIYLCRKQRASHTKIKQLKCPEIRRNSQGD